jgi:hypothetical protein
MNDSYVYDGKEVIPTGRIAKRTTSRGRALVLIEIRPIEIEDNDPQYCKWVMQDDLFVIQDDVNNTDGDTDV